VLEARGLRVTHLKMDPYINVDPGTMSPYQHGEVFVTDDGAETDLDLGHYERFTSVRMNRATASPPGGVPGGDPAGAQGRVPRANRAGHPAHHRRDQAPHPPAAAKADLAIVEVGGTVGDIEGLPFLEAIRQIRNDAGAENVLYIHLTLLPYIKTAGELKTKPTQHSVKELLQVGIQPDLLFCRTERPVPREMRRRSPCSAT
jgi:CTP synthase